MDKDYRYSAAGQNVLDSIVFSLFILRGILQLGIAVGVISATVITTYGGLMILLFGLYFLSTRYVFFVNRKLLWGYVFLFYGFLEILIQGVTLKGLNDLLSYSVYFLLAIYFFCQGEINRQRKTRLFLYLFFCVLFVQIFFVVGLKIGHRGLLGSVLGHANSANLFLAFLVVYFSNSRKWIVVAGVLFLMMIIGGRTSLISASVVAVSIFWSGKVRSVLVKQVVVFFFLFCGILVFSFLLYKGITSAWGETIGLSFFGEEQGRFISLNSIKWRILHWGYFLQDINGFRQVLFGNGIGAHALVSLPIYGQFYEVHNDFLKIFYDFGLIGFSFFLVFDIGIGRFFLSKYRGDLYLVIYLYYIRYTYMLFDNVVTNFMGTFVFVYFIFIFSKNTLKK